jgi:hypothetical protein
MDDLDWKVFRTYGLVMSYVQEFEWRLVSLAHAQEGGDLKPGGEKLEELVALTAGQLKKRLRLPPVILSDPEELIGERNALAHQFLWTYNFERAGKGERAIVAPQAALSTLEEQGLRFQSAIERLFVLRIGVFERAPLGMPEAEALTIWSGL